MIYLKLFEYFTIEDHLKERGIDTQKTRVIIDGDDTYFFLYNLSGQMIGYQKYNPHYPKTGQSNLSNPRLAKYFNLVSDEDKFKKIAAWGLESVDLMNDKFLFITEGIFDCARVHQSGYPGIAVLCNDPSDQLKNWLKTLPQKKIVIYDNDKAGQKLIKVGDFSFSVPVGKDLNDLSPEEAKLFLGDCLSKAGF
jgi:hypothetical protein